MKAFNFNGEKYVDLGNDRYVPVDLIKRRGFGWTLGKNPKDKIGNTSETFEDLVLSLKPFPKIASYYNAAQFAFKTASDILCFEEFSERDDKIPNSMITAVKFDGNTPTFERGAFSSIPALEAVRGVEPIPCYKPEAVRAFFRDSNRENGKPITQICVDSQTGALVLIVGRFEAENSELVSLGQVFNDRPFDFVGEYERDLNPDELYISIAGKIFSTIIENAPRASENGDEPQEVYESATVLYQPLPESWREKYEAESSYRKYVDAQKKITDSLFNDRKKIVRVAFILERFIRRDYSRADYERIAKDVLLAVVMGDAPDADSYLDEEITR